MNSSIHADLGDTVRISARRFEQSPYLECYDTPEMVRGVYADRFYPMSVGENPADKYWTLRRRAVMYDVPERPVEISGPDALPFLEHVLSRPIGSLKEDRGRYAIACTPQGGIFMDGVLFHLGPDRYWYVQPDGALDTWFIAHSGGYDVSISDPKSRVIQIQGPASLDIMNRASGGQITKDMGYFHSGFFDLGGQQLYVSRTGWTGELGYEIYSQGASTDHPALWKHLVQAGEPYGMEFSGITSMEIRRVEAGILDNGTDMDMSMTPFQAGLEPFVDMDKPDFIGRAALVDADRRTLLYGVKCTAGVPCMGDAVLDEDAVVGRVTAGAMSPYLECGIGYVRFQEPGDKIGAMLSLRLSNGETVPCEITALPFYDPEKRIARGLDKTVP